MSAIALVGSVTIFMKEENLQRILLPLVALAAGTLIGGAVLHMLPVSVPELGNNTTTYLWLLAGFLTFLILEQLLQWHHCHKVPSQHKHSLSYLLLIADGLHNFLGGVAIGAVFMTDWHPGMTAWIVAAVHEIPQELGDFGVLVHGG